MTILECKLQHHGEEYNILANAGSDTSELYKICGRCVRGSFVLQHNKKDVPLAGITCAEFGLTQGSTIEAITK